MNGKTLLSGLLSACLLLTGAASAEAASLQLVRWTKINSLGVSPLPGNEYEASGIHYQNGSLYVIFDNSYRVLRVSPTWTNISLSSISPDGNSQYEGITYDPRDTTHFYTIAESSTTGKVNKYTSNAFTNRQEETTDVTFSNQNTGFEGVAWLWHCSLSDPNGDDYLLGLCEKGCDGSPSGTIQVLRQRSSTTPTSWEAVATIDIPVSFGDYSDIALYPPYPQTCDCTGVCSNTSGLYTVAILSQESSALWVGTLNSKTWTIASSGTLYPLPTPNGEEVYCNAEGVTFISPTQVAVASDAYSPGTGSCDKRDESISIFNLVP